MTRRGAAERKIPGVNIQWPWSAMLLSGEKTVETRSYPLPGKYVGRELAIIETPGPRGRREAGIEKARIIGTIVFRGSVEYKTKAAWRRDRARHRVADDDAQFQFREGVPKWGWEVASVTPLDSSMPAPSRRGIVFATACAVPAD